MAAPWWRAVLRFRPNPRSSATRRARSSWNDMTELRVVNVEGSVDGTSYTVLSARIERRLSEVSIAECEITDEARGPDPAALIGKPAEIAMMRDDGSSETRFNGTVIEARHHGEDTERPFVRVRIASLMW